MVTGFAIVGAVLRLVLVLAVAGAICFAAVVLAMAMALLRPPRMLGGRAMFFLRRLSPDDLGLPYEQINFMVAQRPGRTRRGTIRLNGWWIPSAGPSDRCVVLLHGYADSKIGSLAWAPTLRSLGYNILALDLRAHGQSQGTYTTAGFLERYDLMQVIDQLKAAQSNQTRHIVLFGVSLGAAVAAATAVLRDDLAAVVMDCPYVDFPSAVLSHANQLPVPGRTFQRLALKVGQKISSSDYRQVRPLDLIGKIRCPVWVVQVDDDPFISPAGRAEFAAAVCAARGPGAIWQVPGSFHVLALADHPQEYRRRLADFLSHAIPADQVCRP